MLLFVAAYQLRIARVRRSEPILYLMAAWAGAAVLMMIGRIVQHGSSATATVLLGARIYHTGVLTLAPLALAIGHEVRAVPRGRFFWICAIATSVPIPLVWIGHLIISDRVQVFQSFTGPILGPVPSGLAPLGIPYVIAVAAYLTWLARQGRRSLPWHQRLSLGVGTFGLLPVLINDLLLYSGTIGTVELVGIPLFIQSMAINAGIFARASELVAGLEETVAARTADLLAREQSLSRMLAVRRRILDAIPDPLFLLHGRQVDYANDAAERFLGQPRTKLIGSLLTDYIAAGEHAGAERSLAAIEESPRSSRPVDLRFVQTSGAERAAEVAGLAMDLGEGPRLLVTVRDVTERKQLLAKLQAADRLASVGTLAAGVAHEINNPLMFISGNLELMKGVLEEAPRGHIGEAGRVDLQTALEECATGTQRIAQIVKDLNVFSRPADVGSAVDCRAILESALKIAMVTIRHHAAVTVDLGPTPLVNGEPRRLSQVFLNLLVNAFQSIPDDGQPHTIRVSTSSRDDGWAVVEIADSGVGIDPALLPSVFDPFVTTKPVGRGTGLGLFICHGIVTDLGGEIRLLPREPDGTVARVAFPPANQIRRAAAALPSAPGPTRMRPPIRVLIADDEELVLRVLARQLAHYEVTAVGGGVEAIQALENASYDVILCDLMMAGCSGAEVWKKAKQLGFEDRVVLMTGGATTDGLREFVERSEVQWLVKPVTLADIEAAIDACLARQEVTRPIERIQSA